MSLGAGEGSAATCAPTSQGSRASCKAQLFINDDPCGDWVFLLGTHGLEFQAVNAASALAFIVAGAPLLWKADTPIARAYGLMMCGVGVGSFSYHATSSLSGFLVDIVPMAVTAALMLFSAVHALQVDAGHYGSAAATTRTVVCMVSASVAVYIPWTLLMAGVSHYTVWWVWAFLFGSMGAVFAGVVLMVFFSEGVLHQQHGKDLGIALTCVLLGLALTVHSFVPGLCEGWRQVFPFHAFWHLFSSVTANRCGYLLDTLTKMVECMERGSTETCCRKGGRGKLLLVRLLRRDGLPSQFSM
jgi:hypothetical protein